MDKEFDLRNVKLSSDNNGFKTYSLDFSDGENLKTIMLSGKGKLKETVKLN